MAIIKIITNGYYKDARNTSPPSKTCLLFLLTIFQVFRVSLASGYWVFLSPYSPPQSPPSSVNLSQLLQPFDHHPLPVAPTTFCATGVVDAPVNADDNATTTRLVHFRSREALPPQLPHDRKLYHDVFVTHDPRSGCTLSVAANQTVRPFPWPEDVAGKAIVQVVKCFTGAKNQTVCPRCCQYPTKAAVANFSAATGYFAVYDKHNASADSPPDTADLCHGYGDLPSDSLAPIYDIDVVYVEMEGSSMEWLVNDNDDNNASAAVVVWNRRFDLLENFVNWLLLGFIATITMTVSAYCSGLVSRAMWESMFQKRLMRLVMRRRGWRRRPKHNLNADLEEEEEKGLSLPDLIVGLAAFVFISLFLVLIYFCKWIAVPIFLVIYAMSSLSLFTLTRQLIARLPFGATQLRCVTHCPCACLRGWVWEVREILAAACFLTLGWTWYFFRHDKIVILTLHNFLGFSLVFHVANGVRVSRFQTCVYPCLLLLIYDVFMVFVTPYMTAGGMSVMESVARGTEGDDLPLVFKIPALFPTTENRCSGREIAGLLGFGDVVLPAILSSYMVLVGFVLKKPKLYITTTFVSYPLSLVVTIVSLYYMNVAQPALLYIVPIMMLTIVVTAAGAGDLKLLWTTDLFKQYPRKIPLEIVQAKLEEYNRENGGDPEDGEEEEEEGGKEEDGEEEATRSSSSEKTDDDPVIDPEDPDRSDSPLDDHVINNKNASDTSSLIQRRCAEVDDVATGGDVIPRSL